MIVEFSVKNFRSINELQTLSFVASNLKSSEKYADVDKQNIAQINELNLLKTAGIYGPNASGKSNIIKALEYFCEAISEMPSQQSRLTKLAQPFKYRDDINNTESYFQIVLILDDKKYRYGFTVKSNTNAGKTPDTSNEIVTNEWLFGPKNKNLVKYFTRTNLEIDKSNLEDNQLIPPLVYEHSLFLAHSSSYTRNICAKIRSSIGNYITSKFSNHSDYYRFHSIRHLENPDLKPSFLEFLGNFGLQYDDIVFNADENHKDFNFSLDKIFLTKKIGQNTFNNSVLLNMAEHESEGTKKLFDIAGLLLYAFNLNVSGLIILDEIDSNFHPSLLNKLIGMFNDPKINRSNTQLLFTSHDTNLMHPSIMRRDQFYLTEKDEWEGTRLYSLADLKGIRNDVDFAKQYLAGFYGALPILSTYMDEPKIIYDGALGN